MDGLIVHYSKGNKAREILYDITYGESKKKHTHTTNVNITTTTTKKQTQVQRTKQWEREAI